MRTPRSAATTAPAAVVAMVALVGCAGQDPASGVGIPGGDPARTTIVVSASSTSSTTAPAAPTTAASTTTPPTTIPATTTPPPSTSPTTTTPTTVAPTTTELVYVAEAESGTLKYGMEGPRTLQLQRDLITLGHLPAGADDGLYGPGTAGGVRRFQEAHELVVDGVAGPITLAAIEDVKSEIAAPADA